MMNFLSKTESKRKPKLDDSFEVKGSLRSLIHSQTNPKFKEVIKNSEIKLPLSRPSFFKKTQSNQNVSQSKTESKATEIQTLFKLNQNISKKGIDITDTFIKKLKNRINSIISLLSSDYYEYNSIIELADELTAAKKELFNLRFQNATNQLDNTSRIKEVRKNIARIQTVITQKNSVAE